MDFWSLYLVAAFVAGALMASTFLVSLLKKDNSIIDISWGLGFALIAGTTYYVSEMYTPVGLIVSALVVVWGIRLASHVYLRKRGKAEDFRYARWRKEWGKSFILRSILQIYALQGSLMLLVGASIIAANSAETAEFGTLQTAGLAVWLIGFTFEVVADLQLEHFRNNTKNKGNIITSGLWRYSRHPNYFGESLLWIGLWIMVANTPFGMLAVISPLIITLLLRFVSGVPMLEKRYVGNDEYVAYAAKTNIFLPLPVRKRRGANQ